MLRRKRLKRIKEMQRRQRIRERRRKIVQAFILALIMIAVIVAAVNAGGRKKEGKAEQTKEETQSERSTMEVTAHPTQGQIQAMEQYGCPDLYGVYEYPWNTMSQDWDGEQVKGFYYHEISEKAKKEGGSFPVIAQVYTYIVCEQYGVDYEVIFALIEHESKFRWDASGDGGTSIGLMQIAEKWHRERMEKLNCTDLSNPYQNIRVGVDYFAELYERLKDSEFRMADALAAYNYGMNGARKNLWNNGKHWYSYNREIMERAQELKQEKDSALAAVMGGGGESAESR